MRPEGTERESVCVCVCVCLKKVLRLMMSDVHFDALSAKACGKDEDCDMELKCVCVLCVLCGRLKWVLLTVVCSG